MKNPLPGVLAVSLALVQVAWAKAAVPRTASPGDLHRVVSIADPCPTFSWGEVEGAHSYELVIYRAENEGHGAEPVLREVLPGSIYSWTPAGERCLEPGVRFAWSIRAFQRGVVDAWSEPRLFAVSERPSIAEVREALAVLERYSSGLPEYAPSADSPISQFDEPLPDNGTSAPASQTLRSSSPDPTASAVDPAFWQGSILAKRELGTSYGSAGGLLGHATGCFNSEGAGVVGFAIYEESGFCDGSSNAYGVLGKAKGGGITFPVSGVGVRGEGDSTGVSGVGNIGVEGLGDYLAGRFYSVPGRGIGVTSEQLCCDETDARDYVAEISSLSSGESQIVGHPPVFFPNLLALSLLNVQSPVADATYIGFFAGTPQQLVGAIRGDGAGGVQLVGSVKLPYAGSFQSTTIDSVPEAFRLTDAGRPSCTADERGTLVVMRASVESNQDALCYCGNVNGSMDWWCINP